MSSEDNQVHESGAAVPIFYDDDTGVTLAENDTDLIPTAVPDEEDAYLDSTVIAYPTEGHNDGEEQRQSEAKLLETWTSTDLDNDEPPKSAFSDDSDDTPDESKDISDENREDGNLDINGVLRANSESQPPPQPERRLQPSELQMEYDIQAEEQEPEQRAGRQQLHDPKAWVPDYGQDQLGPGQHPPYPYFGVQEDDDFRRVKKWKYTSPPTGPMPQEMPDSKTMQKNQAKLGASTLRTVMQGEDQSTVVYSPSTHPPAYTGKPRSDVEGPTDPNLPATPGVIWGTVRQHHYENPHPPELTAMDDDFDQLVEEDYAAASERNEARPQPLETNALVSEPANNADEPPTPDSAEELQQVTGLSAEEGVAEYARIQKLIKLAQTPVMLDPQRALEAKRLVAKARHQFDWDERRGPKLARLGQEGAAMSKELTHAWLSASAHHYRHEGGRLRGERDSMREEWHAMRDERDYWQGQSEASEKNHYRLAEVGRCAK